MCFPCPKTCAWAAFPDVAANLKLNLVPSKEFSELAARYACCNSVSLSVPAGIRIVLPPLKEIYIDNLREQVQCCSRLLASYALALKRLLLRQVRVAESNKREARREAERKAREEARLLEESRRRQQQQRQWRNAGAGTGAANNNNSSAGFWNNMFSFGNSRG